MDIDEQGAVIFRAGVVMPIEIYSKTRVEEFQRLNETPLTRKKLQWKKVP